MRCDPRQGRLPDARPEEWRRISVSTDGLQSRVLAKPISIIAHVESSGTAPPMARSKPKPPGSSQP